MLRYRLSVEDDELDDYEEGTPINVDDDMGEYGIDDDDEDVPAASIPVAVPVTVTETIIVVEETTPAKKPVAKAVAKKPAPKKKPGGTK